MIRIAVATAAALLVAACGPPPSESGESGAVAEEGGASQAVPGLGSAKDSLYGPDIILKGDGPWTMWAAINAADSKGISIDSVKAGDSITVESIAGVAYFDGQSEWWTFLSVVSVVAGKVEAAITGSSAKWVAGGKSVLDKVSEERGDADASQPRDGFGAKLDGNGYADEEGGVVICAPKARGPKYAHEGNRPPERERVDENGRALWMHEDDCFFASRGIKAVELGSPGDEVPSGVVYIYAFDSNYSDNSGVYEIKFRITRPDSTGTGTNE